MVREQIIDKVREATDIVSLIEEYFPLNMAGSNFKALCPFHQEKTPSFVISPQKQIFHCFGCGESGNVYNFIMKMENIVFADALKRLAERNNIKLSFQEGKEYERKSRIKDDLLELNRRAAVFYNKYLLSNRGSFAREYLNKRGINKDMIEMFNLGYAPGGKELLKLAVKEGVGENLLLKSSLVRKGHSGRLYDNFNLRIIFPIVNESGSVLGFGGRVLNDSKTPKYLNTAQNEIFEKRTLIYGLYQGKDNIRQERKILLLEGYMDVIAAHQFGIKFAVATLGTALTTDHIYKIKRWADEIILAFDADEAGEKATSRGLNLLLESDIRGKVCELPPDKDPEDIIRKDTKLFIKNLEKAVSVLKWRLNYSVSRFRNISDAAERKAEIVKDLMPMIERIKNPIKREETVKMISEKLSISEKSINFEVKRLIRRGKPAASAYNIKKSLTGEERLLKELLHIVIKHPDYAAEVSDILKEKTNKPNKYYNLLENFINRYNSNIHKMLGEVNEKDKKFLSGLLLKEINSLQADEYLNDLKREYFRYIMKSKYEKIAYCIKNSINKNEAVSNSVKKEFSRLAKTLKSDRCEVILQGGTD